MYIKGIVEMIKKVGKIVDMDHNEKTIRTCMESCLELLNNSYEVEYRQGYPIYDERIWAVFRTLEQAGRQDRYYLSKIDEIQNKAISVLELEDICTYLTFIYRQERFCDGHINGFIVNDILKELLQRYLLIE